MTCGKEAAWDLVKPCKTNSMNTTPFCWCCWVVGRSGPRCPSHKITPKREGVLTNVIGLVVLGRQVHEPSLQVRQGTGALGCVKGDKCIQMSLWPRHCEQETHFKNQFIQRKEQGVGLTSRGLMLGMFKCRTSKRGMPECRRPGQERRVVQTDREDHLGGQTLTLLGKSKGKTNGK